MKNLMTQKIVLGMLMTLVLVFSMQGVAEALSALSESTLPADLGTQNIASTFTLTLTATPDRANTRETVSVSVSNATFLVDGNPTPRSSHTFQEADGDENTTGFQDGDLTVSPLTITVTNAGKVNITITGTSSADGTSHRIVRTYYAPQSTVPSTASISLAGISNGISTGAYYYSGPQLVNTGSGNYPVTYTITGATAEIKEGTRTATYTSGTRTSTAARISLQNRTTSATVTATVGASEVTGVYVYGVPTLDDTVRVASAASDGTATAGQTITDAFTATVRDGASSPALLVGVPVKFEVKDKSVSGGTLLPGDSTIVDSSNRTVTNPKPGKILYVRTVTGGTAAIDYKVGSAGKRQVVIVSAVGEKEEAEATTAAAPERVLSVHANVRRTGTTSTYDLIILLKDDGVDASGVTVTFDTLKGTLTNTPTGGSPDTGTQVTQTTGSQGLAHVIYNAGDNTGVLEVVASVHKTANAIANDTPESDKVKLVFNVSGGSVTPQQPTQPTTGTAGITLNLDPIRGAPDDTVTLQATVRNTSGYVVQGVNVNFTISDNSGSVSPSSDVTNANGVAQTTVTIPDDDATLTASATGYTLDQVNVISEAAPTDLEVVSGSGQTGAPGSTLSSAFVVRFEDSDGEPVSGAVVTFAVETGGGSISDSTDTTDSDGEAETTLTLGSTGGRNTVRASVSGTDYPGVSSVTFTADAELPAEAIIIAGGDEQTGQIGRRLDEDLSVQVVDRDDDGISGTLVRFRVTEGRGRLARNSARTDSDGYADVGFTPSANGEITVEAYAAGLSSAFFTIYTGEPPAEIVYVSGNNQSGKPGARLANPLVVEVVDANDDPVSGVSVRFAVTAGGGSVSPATATTNNNGRAQTKLTLGDALGENTVAARVTGLTAVTFKASSGSQVLVPASQRPPMYWVSRADGKLHRLVDEAVENLAPNVTGVTGIAVDTTNDLLYFGVQTGPNKGQIRRSNLNGRNVQTLKTLTAVPRGIALDGAGSTVYWTNSRGRIQSIATEGSAQLTNLLQNLSNPSAITLSNGFLYWAEPLGRIRRVNLTAIQRGPQNIVTGLGEPLSLSIAKGKIYWVERDADGGGRLQRASLDGSNIQQLKTFASGAPVALAVDSSNNKIYWTKGAGKIQRANLAGKFVKDIATGLVNPGDIALGVATGTTTSGQQANNQQANNQQSNNQQQTTYSAYDVNKDGKVNGTDTRQVRNAIGQSGNAIANSRTDVNADGTVDMTDLLLVIDNLDADAAAPALDLDLKALDIDFDRVQEQIEALLASGDNSIAAQRALLYLQHLLASARPDETVLLANYPNPFNPETWIPYHLAESTDVRVNIYDAQGVMIRVLTVGHQTAGYYTSRSRAAYWDGRNALGERVASGIYFYQLQTDELSPLRKMVILK